MEKYKEKLRSDAQQLAEYADNSEYLTRAFFHIFGKKLLEEGYVDCSYILGALGKGTYYSRLKAQDSALYTLYAGSCITSENLEIMINYMSSIIGTQDRGLTPLEEGALVFWIFLPYLGVSKREKRLEYLKAVLNRFIREWDGKYIDTTPPSEEKPPSEVKAAAEPSVQNPLPERNLLEKNGVIYDANSCELELIENVSSYVKDISDMRQSNTNHILYFRGHSRLSYELLPGIKRSRNWMVNENRMYQELILRCTQDFAQCQSHLDYLVEMQHYGLPTRLLDITENPLVALYFACCSSRDSVGEVIVLQTETASTKYARSDTAAILAAIPVFDYAFQTKLYELCVNGVPEEQDREYLQYAAKLAGEVKSKNPGFEPRIRKKDLLSHVFIMPLRSNPRIMKQDGSFILCGLGDGRGEGNSLRTLRYRNKSGKKLIFIVKNKENILRELDLFSINKAALFPEIDDVAEYIKEKYTK